MSRDKSSERVEVTLVRADNCEADGGERLTQNCRGLRERQDPFHRIKTGHKDHF
jgi:hypothetical protein